MMVCLAGTAPGGLRGDRVCLAGVRPPQLVSEGRRGRGVFLVWMGVQGCQGDQGPRALEEYRVHRGYQVSEEILVILGLKEHQGRRVTGATGVSQGRLFQEEVCLAEKENQGSQDYQVPQGVQELTGPRALWDLQGSQDRTVAPGYQAPLASPSREIRAAQERGDLQEWAVARL